MIRNFRSRALQRLMEHGDARRIRAGFWAVTVRANWRVIFRFDDGYVVDVDYH